MNDMQHTGMDLATAQPPAGAEPVRVQARGGILTPTSLTEALKMADILADSTIVPKDFQGKPGNVLVAVQWGGELGLAPLQAMQSIAVINGRPSLWGDAVIALVRSCGAMDYIHETLDEDTLTATCTVKRKGDVSEVVRTFSMEDARKAGLASKPGPWQQYTKRMLQLRARGFALRDAFPDVLRGLWIAEEAQDTPVMRDVTPGDDAPTASKTEAVKGKLSAKAAAKAPAPTQELDEILKGIEEAEDENALNVMGAKCATLSGEAKNTARKAYGSKLHALRDAAADDAEILDDPMPSPEEMARAEAEAQAEIAQRNEEAA